MDIGYHDLRFDHRQAVDVRNYNHQPPTPELEMNEEAHCV